ncbi:hypothetical protein predicted by Glimmer/Critica [Sorangium cellulosum So ce56]|uniref:Uncharacterized protein n=1 Tax=Sorangium cellulosum (strain So ce56) TaxID=448385 RepID=A9FCB5_SORC5|nr:hypothetical protein predicted by Glimmer/Critica [Sorangium cellulosum So ce56]
MRGTASGLACCSASSSDGVASDCVEPSDAHSCENLRYDATVRAPERKSNDA